MTLACLTAIFVAISSSHKLILYFSEFPTSQPELEAVADKFDKNKDGFIDYKEFMAALRTEVESRVR